MGSFDDYHFLQVVISNTTITLVNEGELKTNLELASASLSESELKFNLKGNSPTSSDEVQLIFEKSAGDRETSSKVRLTVN